MPTSRIRFSCACGKRLAAPASAAGRRGQCPRCGQSLTVPLPVPVAARDSAPVPPRLSPCDHPRLEELAQALRTAFADRLDRYAVVNGCPELRFVIPEHRQQSIRLSVERDAHDREWLVIGSEIGTVTMFEETTAALRLNRQMPAGRLFLDDYQVLQLEHRLPLNEVDESTVAQAVDAVSRAADEFEAQLFGIDVR